MGSAQQRHSLAWFRRDLRLADNPAWAAATRDAAEVSAVFVLDPVPLSRSGERRRALLLGHLRELHRALAAEGGGLWLLEGDPSSVVPELAERLGITSVHANADVSGYAQRRDGRVREALGEIPLELHWGNLVHEPGSVVARSTGEVHKVFTPFHKAWRGTARSEWPTPGEVELRAPDGEPAWPEADDPPMEVGEEAASQRLAAWNDAVEDYPELHDLPASEDGTSGLSADLRFGVLSVRHCIDVVGDRTEARRAWVRQLAWRDWYAHLFNARPELARHAVDPGMDDIEWSDDADGLARWKAGLTGYPLVDAGMRQLAGTGTMHNRVRMVTASFLVKDLLVDWREGESHFRELLVDYDLPQNAGNWQWVAGTGTDAAPYFRILNPVTQSRRFDSDGEYIRRWVPELAELSDDDLHAPWEADEDALQRAGITLGADYPEPIVDHGEARDRTLAAYEAARGRS